MNPKKSKYSYYSVSLNEDDGSLWHKVLDYILPKTNFVEFCGGFDTTNREYFPADPTDPLPISLFRESTDEIMAGMYEQLCEAGFKGNAGFFYSSKWNYGKYYGYEWVFARLELDEQLLKAIRKYKNFVELAVNKNNDDFMQDPVFYKDDTAVMWTVHSEMLSFLLLTEEEKEALESEGFVFIEKRAWESLTIPEYIANFD